MGRKQNRFAGLPAILLAILLASLLVSCAGAPSPASSDPEQGSGIPEESVSSAPPSAEESEEAAPENSAEDTSPDSLPPPEAIVLLYTDYLTVRTEQDGLEYQYTYCFDAEGQVFNAVAVIRFPTEEEAQREYHRLRERSYPNLQLDGEALSFCFPRKECPFYGISYRSLEVLLEETVYEIIERHPPQPTEESGENGGNPENGGNGGNGGNSGNA